jgi:DNA-3-methyladenine glycosylase
MGTLINQDYYKTQDVVFLSKDMLGKFLLTSFDGKLTGGMIIETEAYKGPEDKASHAYGNRRTKRNEVMYHNGGICYVYLCYGIHALFNIVTNKIDIPHAILIRAIEPSIGIEHMLDRRGKKKWTHTLTSGPGSLTVALGIKLSHNGLSVTGPDIWLEDRGIKLEDNQIMATPRIGVDYAGEDAALPWRFIYNG